MLPANSNLIEVGVWFQTSAEQLSIQDAHAIGTALTGTSGEGWQLEQHRSYDGQLSLMLNRQDDPNTFWMIDGEAQGFRLSRIDGDDLQRVGTFAQVNELLRALR